MPHPVQYCHCSESRQTESPSQLFSRAFTTVERFVLSTPVQYVQTLFRLGSYNACIASCTESGSTTKKAVAPKKTLTSDDEANHTVVYLYVGMKMI